MIDNEMSCSPNPQWLKDFKQEIQKEFNLTSLDATCIAGKVARIVRKRDEKACEWVNDNKQPVLASETDDTIVGYSISVEEFIEWLKTMEE